MKRLEILDLIKKALKDSKSSLLKVPRVFKIFTKLFKVGDLSRYYFYDLSLLNLPDDGKTLNSGLDEGFAVCVYKNFKRPYMAFFNSMGVLTGLTIIIGKTGQYNIPKEELDYHYDLVIKDLTDLKSYMDKHGLIEMGNL